MKLSDFDYTYSPDRVAQYPSAERGKAKLLVAHRKTQEIIHTAFENIIDFLYPGDCLVINDTKVLPARILTQKPTGGKQEIFLLRRISSLSSPRSSSSRASDEGSLWECLVEGKKKYVQLSGSFIEQHGQIPLPPYIKRSPEEVDKERYQTVFAQNEGAVAAPTAGLHWTEDALEKAKQKGVEIASVTLHVGIGTFLPIRVENILDHTMHREFVEISEDSANKINRAKKVAAVGTTTVRALESRCFENKIQEGSGWTDLFIYPGYTFKVVDVLQTNFHQPKSTLLVMVSAFAGREFVLRCYQEAIRHGYPLFSYGDTMLIL